MQIKEHPDGVAIIPSEEAFDENLPGQINLTYAEAEELSATLEDILDRRESEQRESTPNNPTGTVRQCDRRDIHEAHDYQAGFGDYFDVHCPGNRGIER